MKTRFKVLLPFLLLSALPATVQAQFTFTPNNSTITSTGYTGSGGDVTLPDMTNGHPVSTIGINGFQCISSLAKTTIGINVTSIGNSAFSNCCNLVGVTLGPGSGRATKQNSEDLI